LRNFIPWSFRPPARAMSSISRWDNSQESRRAIDFTPYPSLCPGLSGSYRHANRNRNLPLMRR
jgi:hypothetical protein